MSKLRLAAGIVAVVATLVAGVAVAFAKQQERKDGPPPRAEYTVASTAAESAAVTTTPRVAVPLFRRGGLGPLPDTLTLVVVGGLLLGLAAAVRRTT